MRSLPILSAMLSKVLGNLAGFVKQAVGLLGSTLENIFVETHLFKLLFG